MVYASSNCMFYYGAILVLSIIVSALGGGGEDTATDKGDNESNESSIKRRAPAEKVYGLNEVVPADQTEITVTKMEELSVIGDPDFHGKEASQGALL